MRNTISRTGGNAHARLDSAFSGVKRASAIASGEDIDLDLDEDESEGDDEEYEDDTDDEDADDEDEFSDDEDSEDDESEEEDEDEFSDDESDDEDEDEFSDDESEEEDEESDADEDEFEEENEESDADEDEFEFDADDEFEEELDDEEEDEESDADDEFEEDVTAFFTGEADASDDEDEFEGDEEGVSEAEAIAALEAAGLCVVIATSDDDEILESDLALAVASLEDDEFEEDVTEFFAEASEEDEEDDEDEFSDESEEEDEDEFSDDESEEEDEVDAEDDTEHLTPVATEEFLMQASVEDVEFHVTADAHDPVVNVIVASVPAARIALSSLGEHAAESRGMFGSEKYLSALRNRMATSGVLNFLVEAGAEFYATAYRNSDLFAEACASAESIGNERIAVAMSGIREDFVDAIKLVSAGMDKNFFNIRNPLKQALFVGLAHAGVANPASVIESAFAEASEAHFEAVVEKAVEIMDKSPEAREELREAIGESGTIDRTASAATATAREIPVAAPAGLQVVREASASVATAGSVTGTVAERKHAIRGLGFGA
jgi:topoisomerase-4 subunit A